MQLLIWVSRLVQTSGSDTSSLREIHPDFKPPMHLYFSHVPFRSQATVHLDFYGLCSNPGRLQALNHLDLKQHPFRL